MLITRPDGVELIPHTSCFKKSEKEFRNLRLKQGYNTVFLSISYVFLQYSIVYEKYSVGVFCGRISRVVS